MAGLRLWPDKRLSSSHLPNAKRYFVITAAFLLNYNGNKKKKNRPQTWPFFSSSLTRERLDSTFSLLWFLIFRRLHLLLVNLCRALPDLPLPLRLARLHADNGALPLPTAPAHRLLNLLLRFAPARRRAGGGDLVPMLASAMPASIVEKGGAYLDRSNESTISLCISFNLNFSTASSPASSSSS